MRTTVTSTYGASAGKRVMERAPRFIYGKAEGQGERVEKRGGETAGAEVSGIQLYGREGAEAQDCAEGDRPIQGADPRDHASEQGEELGAGHGGTGRVCERPARL